MEKLKVKYTKRVGGGYNAHITDFKHLLMVKQRQAATGYWVATDVMNKEMKGFGATRQEAVENLHAQY